MDAERKTVAVTIAGRPVDLIMPNESQMLGLHMLETTPGLPDMARLDGMMGMFMSMMPTDDDRAWFAMQMACGTYTIENLMASLKAVGTSPTAVVRPRKTAAKKTAAKRRTG